MSAAPGPRSPEEASYLHDLNPQQREAVLAPPGPTLVLAGAGSGKTRVIVRRILHLLSGGTPPGAILALTFTNKAAGEMRDRLADALVPGARGVWLGTFHATGARILRQEYDRLHLPRDFVVMSRGECLTILKREMKKADISSERYPPRSVLERIGRFKTGEKTPEADSFAHTLEAVAARLAPRYERTLRAGGGLDFDDLLALPLRLFREHPGVLDRYRERFAEILVDEFQDTNAVQNRLVILLAGDRRRVFAVGDDDQSIYRWRGAEVENIRRFEREFQGARIFQLEENYRSTGNILSAAGAVMQQARGRREKRLFTNNSSGEAVVYFSAPDPGVEAQMICQRLAKAGAGEAIPWSEVAIFYRTNTQSRPFEEEARRRRIPYQVVKGQRFFDRTEVQDLAAYLRVVNRAGDAAAFTRIINRPVRGLGPSKILAIGNEAGEDAESGLISMDAARRALESGRITGAASRSLGELIGTIEKLAARPMGPAAMLEAVMERTGYRKWLRDISAGSVSPERRRAAERGLEGVEEFVAAAYAFEERAREEEGTSPEDPEAMTRFLEELALSSEADEIDDEGGKLSLMTLHAAKGLEFQAVAVAGVQDGLIPHSRSLDEPESLEEERRLLYVGMTRAKERLMMSWARERRPESGGGWESAPSRFLELLDDDLLVREESAPTGAGLRFGKDSPDIFSDSPRDPTRSKEERKVLFVPGEALGPFAPGARVVHPKFGPGIIAARSGSGARAVVTVDFEQVGSKKLVLHHALLQPAGDAVDGGETPTV
ncbi:MAG: UvrD-helicase domain-containing protein [bacterium]